MLHWRLSRESKLRFVLLDTILLHFVVLRSLSIMEKSDIKHVVYALPVLTV